MVGTGLALSNTLAIAKGLFGKNLPFRRTPKFRIEARADRWLDNRYTLPFDWIVVAELALALYALAAVVVALLMGKYLAIPFLLLYVAAYGYIGLHGLRDGWVHSRFRARHPRVPVVVDS
jgi:hypothetical protein